MKLENFSPIVWEPACGEGHMSEVLKQRGYSVISTDKVDRGYGKILDFLEYYPEDELNAADIITNPPYKYAMQFVEHALEISKEGTKVAMFLKIQFFEGQGRAKLFKENPPKQVYVSAKRLKCAINGDFDSIGSSATCYCWFIWEKGYKGQTVISRFNEE